MDTVPDSIECESKRTAYRSAERTALSTADLTSYDFIYEKQSAQLSAYHASIEHTVYGT